MNKSVAQKCLDSDDPLSAARAQQGYKGHPQKDVLRFHFEDNSCLDFQMTYTPISVGMVFEDGRRSEFYE